MTEEEKNHLEAVKSSFRKQLKRQKPEPPEILEELIQHLDLKPDLRVLEVAAGNCILAQKIAPLVSAITAVDVTEEGLEKGKTAAEETGINSISFKVGSAEAVPLEAEKFDLVFSRYSLHHCLDPSKAFREMVRMCKTGGRVAVYDLIQEDEALRAEKFNYFQKLRDPSHTRILTLAELETFFTSAGIKILKSEKEMVDENISQWVEVAHPGFNARNEIMAAADKETKGGEKTGLEPFVMDRRIRILQKTAFLLGQKEPLPAL